MEVLGKGAGDSITYPEFRRWACLCPSWQVWGNSVDHSYGSHAHYHVMLMNHDWVALGPSTHSCLAPQVEGGSPLMMAGWLRSAPAVAKAVRRRQEPHPVTDPRQQFAVFDLLLRASMAGSLAFMILVAMTQD